LSKLYLKTYCYAPHEIDFIRANLQECYPFLEKMIVCEFDVNHTGMKRDFKFGNIKDNIPIELQDKLEYHQCSIYDHTVEAYNNEADIHNINEPVMRSWFTKLYNFSPNDIVISIDADEIIYGDKIEYIKEQVEKYGVIGLKLRQFFYKKNYLWRNKDFTSPIATYYGLMNPAYPNNWRDFPRHTEEYVGGHFSWCMSAEEMVHKLHTYSHPQYRFCAKKDLLEDAIQNKKYPFDTDVDFDIEELDVNDKRIPLSLRSN
jgi:hypothetical protein